MIKLTAIYAWRGNARPAFTIIEAVVLMVILSIVGVGVGVGLQSATRVPELNDRALAVSAELASEMDTWRANAWTGSTWPASLPSTTNDTVTLSIGGQSKTFNRTVSIQTWDPNNLASNSFPQANFAKVTITINSQTIFAFFTNPN